MLVPVLLSGGTGSRLWPLSRELYPKQFLPLQDKLTLLQQTLVRTADMQLCNASAPVIVCNHEHRFIVAQQLRDLAIDSATIILEPLVKNTAPAIAVAAIYALTVDPEAILLVMPADHVIAASDAFREAIDRGLPKAQDGYLVTFGIVPTGPETGYGYIKRFEKDLQGCFAIESFTEKPQLEQAKNYLVSGNYFWNSGLFLFSAQALMDELKAHVPDILAVVDQAFTAAQRDLDFIRLDEQSFAKCPNDSLDYAIMEKTTKGMVVPLPCDWSDIGSWSALWEVAEKDSHGNVTCGDTLLQDTQNSYIRSESRLVTTLGVDELVVVETADAVLIADKKRAQSVKTLVAQLKAQQRSEANVHTTVYRPWGSYESLVVEKRFQVKRIIVNPGQCLSLQMHHHRAEHWVVVSGTAKVLCGDKELSLVEDQSTYIPIGTKHRLENPGVIPLELIEIQSGSYLGEDDIIRFDDKYGRTA